LKPVLTPLGDAALLIELGSRLDPALNARARRLAEALNRRPEVEEAVPGHCSVTVYYDPDRTGWERLAQVAGRALAAPHSVAAPGRLHRIPVCYDGQDLLECAERLQIASELLIRLHGEPTYRCFMVGFVPGWGYLGTLDERLRLPRRDRPRPRVLPGSVAIADDQTGIYPLAVPGGWNLIGRTPMKVLLPDSNLMSILRVGDRVKFYPI